MRWVGILLIRNQTFYLNGRLVARTLDDFFNHCCFFSCPKIMIVFCKSGFSKQDAFQAKMSQWFQSIIYTQYRPFIYVHQKKERYAVGVAIGIILSAIGWCLMLSLFMHGMVPQSHKRVNLHAIMMSQLKKACGVESCIKRVGIFPNAVMVEFEYDYHGLSTCYEYKKRSVLCLNHRLLLD